MSINRLVSSRYMVWVALFLPPLVICLMYWRQQLYYGEFIHLTGEWSVRLLILTMAISPLRIRWSGIRWIRWLHQQRRYLGLAVFAFAVPHLLAYLLKVRDEVKIFEQGIAPDLLTGWLAMVLFLSLALTSNNQSMRLLGKAWKKLHRWIYAAAVLTFVHWVLVAFDPTSAVVHAGVLGAIQCLRWLPTGKMSG